MQGTDPVHMIFHKTIVTAHGVCAWLSAHQNKRRDNTITAGKHSEGRFDWIWISAMDKEVQSESWYMYKTLTRSL